MTLVPPRVVPLRYSRISWRGRTLVIGTAALILLLTAGCGSSSSDKAAAPAPPAATVTGAKVSAAAVLADLKAEAAAGKKGKAKTEPSSPLASPKAANGTYTPAATAAALTNRILYELYGQELVAHHAKVAADDKDRARQSLCSDATTGQPPTGTACPPLAVYSATYRNFQLGLRERELAFGKVLYGQVFDTVKRTQPKLLREICLNLVQVADASTSKQVVSSMKGGASMADASKKAAAAGKASTVQPGCLLRRCGASEPGQGDEGRGRAGHERVRHGCRGGDIVQDGHQGRVRDAATRGSTPPSKSSSRARSIDRSGSSKIIVAKKYGRWDPAQLIVVAPKSKSTTTSGPSTTGTTPTTTAKPTTTAPAEAAADRISSAKYSDAVPRWLQGR